METGVNIEGVKKKYSSRYQKSEPKNQTVRSSRSNNLEIKLTTSDPLDRLKEFCNQGNYVYHFNWDKFKTGVMCELEISYQIGDKKKTLTKEVRYVPGNDIKYARKVVSAILLERIGLSLTEDTENDNKLPEDLTEFIAENQEKFQKFFSRDGEKSPLQNTVETGPVDLKNFALSALLKVTNLMKEESDDPPGLRETLIETPDYSLQNKELEERSKSWASIVANAQTNIRV